MLSKKLYMNCQECLLKYKDTTMDKCKWVVKKSGDWWNEYITDCKNSYFTTLSKNLGESKCPHCGRKIELEEE